MNITFDKKKIEVEMKDQIREAIQWYVDFGNAKPPTPAAKHLFMINEDAETLEKSVSETYHSVVAKLLYTAKELGLTLNPQWRSYAMSFVSKH